MDFMALFGQGQSDDHAAPEASAYATRLVRLEDKIDLLLQDLAISDDKPQSETGLPPRVRALAAQGRKIEAIKAYRDETGAGLKEAKDAVEGKKGGTADTLGSLERKIDLVLTHLGIDGAALPAATAVAAPAASAPAMSGPDEVTRYIAAGRMIQAIKAYRDLTGCDLRTAKEYVDQRAAAMRRSGMRR